MFPLIEVGGTPYDIGFQHGSLAKEQVHQSIRSYRAMFLDFSGIEWSVAQQRALGYVDEIHAFSADLYEELRGLAEGAEVPFEDILALNTRSELVLQGRAPLPDIDGCTALAAGPERCRDGRTLLGQNWDWKLSQRAACIVLKIRRAGGPDILMVTEAGIIGKIGFNSAGLGVCLNALATDAAPRGLPLHIALRGILDCETLSDAVQIMGSHKPACCANFLIAHANGELVDIEIGPDDYDVLYPERGLLAHTNHFRSPRLIAFKDTSKLRFPDSFVRCGRVLKLAEALGHPIAPDDYRRLLSDHVEHPDSICRHEDPKDPEGLRMGTVFSIMMDLGARRMWMAPGEPCCTEYEEYSL